MDVEILKFSLKPTRLQMGMMLIRYHQLVLRCQLVYSAKYVKVWIRMPEVWYTPDKKTSFCHWPNKQISDEFQKLVLEQLYARYKLTADKVAAEHSAYWEKLKKPKKQ